MDTITENKRYNTQFSSYLSIHLPSTLSHLYSDKYPPSQTQKRIHILILSVCFVRLEKLECLSPGWTHYFCLDLFGFFVIFW